MTAKSPALAGVRVLDLSSAIAGPYCGQLLGDLGADVIKVEHPGRALSERVNLSPPAWSGPPFSPYFLSTNRNKRSITLNLKTEEGKTVLGDLIRVSDVVIENFSAHARADLVNEEWAWQINPRVIWASLSYTGRTGPDADAAGYDLLAQARSGLMSVTGFPDGPPTKTGDSLGDYMAGAHLAIGVLGALHQREVIGKGQLVDTSLLEPMIACLDGLPMWYSIAGILPGRVGNRHPAIPAAYAAYECRDGYIVISSGSGRWLPALAEQVLQMPELLPVPESHEDRYRADMARIDKAIADWARARSVREATATLVDAGVPNEPVRNLAEVWTDQQLDARGMLIEYEYRELGSIRTIGSPLHLSESPVEVRHVPPAAGEHNEEVLAEILGYDAERIDTLMTLDVLWGWT